MTQATLAPEGIAYATGMTASTDWQRIALLVEQAREGDEDAFRGLLIEHREVVTQTLMACGVRSIDTAADLGQEVALRAWMKLSSLRDARTFRAWIRRIAANAARDHLRRLAIRREEALEQAIDLAGDDDPHHDAQRTSEIRLMMTALEEEDPEVVELLVARAEGVPVDELARRLELSPAALKMRLMRARKRLRKRLQDLEREPPAGDFES